MPDDVTATFMAVVQVQNREELLARCEADLMVANLFSHVGDVISEFFGREASRMIGDLRLAIYRQSDGL